MQLADLIADRRGDGVFLEDARSGRVLTYADLQSEIGQWRGAGRVVIGVADPLRCAATLLGVVAAGGCAVPIDPKAPDAEFERLIAATGANAVVRDNGTTTSGAPVATTPAIRLHTSGSTGAPKAVDLDEDRLLHVARSVAAHNELTAHDRGYCPLPLFHVNAQVVGLLATLVAGATLVVDDRFHRTGFWTLLQERRITWVNAVPAILAILATETPDPIPDLRFVRSASAPLPPVVRDRIESALGTVVVESYGMTEAASQITATPLRGGAPAGSAGKPVGCELQVRGNRVWIRGPGVITGYVGGRAADRFDAEGWLDTGDLGAVDADGFLILAGRSDDVINRGGELVFPREVEEILLGHPGVREAVVVGRPHDILGAVPVAYLVVAGELDVAGLTERCAAQLSRFKRPVEFLQVEDFPRASTGKIRRHEVGVPA